MSTDRQPVAIQPFLDPVDVIFTKCSNIGKAKATAPWFNMLWNGYMGGFWIAMGGHVAISIGGGLDVCDEDSVCTPSLASGLQKFLFMLMFPTGLVAVVVTGADLWTGSCMLASQAVCCKKITVWNYCWYLVLNWCLNFCGALTVAYFFSYLGGVFKADPYIQFVRNIAVGRENASVVETLFKSLACNLLVSVSIFQAVGTHDMMGKCFVLFTPVICFGVSGWEHTVANMYLLYVSFMYGSPADPWLITGYLGLNSFGNWLGVLLILALPFWFMYGEKCKGCWCVTYPEAVKVTPLPPVDPLAHEKAADEGESDEEKGA